MLRIKKIINYSEVSHSSKLKERDEVGFRRCQKKCVWLIVRDGCCPPIPSCGNCELYKVCSTNY